MTAQSAPQRPTDQVDARGLRFAAGITSAVLALALVVPEPYRVLLVSAQWLVFAISAGFGLKQSPYGLVFVTFVKPRLTGPAQPEDAAPPRFAQFVGFLFTTGALIAFALEAETVLLVLVAFALIAAFLNAAVGFCLGCEIYLILRRLAPRPPAHS